MRQKLPRISAWLVFCICAFLLLMALVLPVGGCGP
jgi:hypothetical protein